MAGVTDLPFRLLCKEQGCGLMYTEMVSAKAILYKNKNTGPLMEVSEAEKPVALQLFGSDPEIVSSIAAQVEDGPYAFIDLNMGCPVPKVVGNGEGSALMKDPKLTERLLTALVKRVKKPVTVKIRKGFGRRSCQRGGDCPHCRKLRRFGSGGTRPDPPSSSIPERRTGRLSGR